MKTLLSLLLVLLIIAGAGAVLLFFLPDKPAKNGFTRGKIYHAKKMRELNIKYNSYYISGLSDRRIYFGNYTAPLSMFDCSYNLRDTLYERLPFTYTPTINWQLAKMQIDSPYVYLTEYKTPSLVSAMLPFKQEMRYDLKGINADMLQVLSPKSLLINGYDNELKQKVLQKFILQPEPKQTNRYVHLTEQDGNFSVDGFMFFNKEKGAVLFAYYYKNKFVCLDTNLNVRFNGNTIDTNVIPKMKITEIESNGRKSRTMTKPPLYVNKRGKSYGNYIYIHTALIADNEDPHTFEKHEVIDVYDLQDGKYSHSLYLPKYKGQRLTDFAVKSSVLIALFDRGVVMYDIGNDHQG